MAYSEIDFSDPGFLMNYCENLSLEIASLKAEVKKLTEHNTAITKCPNAKECFPTIDRALRNS